MNTEKKTLQTEVFEAMGETSMCWEPIPSGVFQSTKAERIGKELMAKIESDVPNAIKAITKALEEDEAYHTGWQSNIAMAFYDECIRFCKANKKKAINEGAFAEVANNAAKNFLTLLCSKPSVEAPNSGVVE